MSNLNPSLYEIPFQKIDGKPMPATEIKNRVLLFVNTASECGFTPQYKGLESLYEKYRERGLTVIGVPCNQFGAQEPGDESQIKSFCEMKFGVQFPMLKKSDVKGSNQSSLYKFLIQNSSMKEEISWNFEKFLVGRNGEVLGHFKSKIEPENPKLVAEIESALKGK